jgi:type VI secretion system secreted protein Hcp
MHKILLGATIAAAIMLACLSLMTPQQSFAQTDTTTNQGTNTDDESVQGGSGSCNTSTPTHRGYFLTVDGINGTNGSPCIIEIASWSFGVTGPGASASATGGGGTGRASFHDLSFTKTTDKASSVLFKSCVNGKHYSNATIEVRKAGGKQVEFLQIKMTEVLISSFQSAGSGGGENPTESISLNFAQLSYEFKPQS